MFINFGNRLFNLNNVGWIKIDKTDIILGLVGQNYLLRYKNEDLAKNAYSKIRFGIVKGSFIVDISEDKVQNDLI